jgi:hypothetical protein
MDVACGCQYQCWPSSDTLLLTLAVIGTPCSGNANEHCGGKYQIAVYNYSCTGAPVPKPFPTPSPPPPYVPPRPCVFNDPKCSELYNPCRNLSLPYHAMPFCNPELSLDERVDDMIRRTSLSEKIAMLGNRGSAVAGLGTNPYNWWSEASTGVANWVERRGSSTETTKL